MLTPSKRQSVAFNQQDLPFLAGVQRVQTPSVLLTMSLFMAAMKKEAQADVHRNQTDNFFDDFQEAGENQTPSAPTAQENPSVSNSSLGISPSASESQKTIKLSLTITFQPAQPKPSAGTSIRGKATSKTMVLQELLWRLKERRWELQQKQQQLNQSFPPKQPLQKPPQPQLQPRSPTPQTRSPTPQTTQQPNEEPPTLEVKPQNPAAAELDEEMKCEK
ncbi:probable serine/threonine-protein kinase samkC [Oryzias melastigma]|uniref:probable serine/threonine-protein kinase samkC n=1 Tax=Oryzias melastigma TaxID=30732 RepID=UPI000CF7F4E2|nr:probable serine/threonine-protein kinase samkC [Oryzias melastigma]